MVGAFSTAQKAAGRLSAAARFCRHLSGAATPAQARAASPLSFVFDIDGVLLQSRTAIPRAAATLKLLKAKHVPFVLLTNGGGVTEAQRVHMINSILDNGNQLIRENQLVQSHTPLRRLSKQYSNVMLVGGNEGLGREVGLSYGFQNIVRPVDLLKIDSKIWPFSKYDSQDLSQAQDFDFSRPIDLVVVINDPRDMGTDMQVLLDVLNCSNGIANTRRDRASSKPSVPIIWSNMDLFWSTGYSLPRFGQGAFRVAVRELYKQMNDGLELKDEVWGKPNPIAYDYAKDLLQNGPGTVYMVGDNPESDIKGANAYGWESILLKTGVYQEGDFKKHPHLSKPSLGVYDDVWDGVHAALAKHGVQ